MIIVRGLIVVIALVTVLYGWSFDWLPDGFYRGFMAAVVLFVALLVTYWPRKNKE